MKMTRVPEGAVQRPWRRNLGPEKIQQSAIQAAAFADLAPSFRKRLGGYDYVRACVSTELDTELDPQIPKQFDNRARQAERLGSALLEVYLNHQITDRSAIIAA